MVATLLRWPKSSGLPYTLAPNLATLFAAYIVGAPIVAIFLVVQGTT